MTLCKSARTSRRTNAAEQWPQRWPEAHDPHHFAWQVECGKVVNELLNQHPRIQEREKGHHRKPFHHSSKDYKREWTGRNGKGYSWSYAAMEDDETAANFSLSPWLDSL